MVHPRVSDTQPVASILEMVLRDSCSGLTKVDEVVQTIHTELAHVSQKPLQDILRRTLLQLAHLYPQEVTTGLLQASPLCDSTARAMWKMLASEPCLADDVLKRLLLIQQKGTRQHHCEAELVCCNFVSLTGAMHEIFLVASRCCVTLLFHELFMAVILQISFSLKDLQQNWSSSGSQSREAEHHAVCSLRNAVSTTQALFHWLGGDSLVEDLKRQGAWHMLMRPKTCHTGFSMLARALCHEAPAYSTAVSKQAVTCLLQRQDYQDVGAMAVFVELLDCTDLEHVTASVLRVLQFHLYSKSLVLRRMAVRSFVKLCGRPEKAATLQSLLPDIMERLQDDDSDVRMAALTFLGNMLCLADRETAVPIALQLVEMLLPLFEDEASYVREHSVLLWRDAMEVAVSTHEKLMRKDVQTSLVPLFFHLHDKDNSVAQLTEDSSRVEEYLHQSLPYLQNPQKPLRRAAVRFIGLAGRQLRDGHQQLQVIYNALQDTANDSSISVSSLVRQTLLILDTAVKEPPSGFRLQALCHRLRRAWRRRTPAPGDGWLCCWSHVQS
ncbi:maestro heat-like repeat-containing protein family member 7 isoform X2 [Calonectris borealis]|uniref:maestro heat-like repeat-containing protein family member 7 isoform X2 n=1 Tax=Calonectris borealis TaxID=1323832 RepID=UPI003F4C28CF